MKRLYLLSIGVFIAGISFAQNAAISACNDPSGGIQLRFDLEQNCDLATGSLADLDTLGFHSGMNMWMNVVDFDAETAVMAINEGDSIYRVYIPDVDAYYGVDQGTVNRLDFVFNQGITNPDDPWASEGKDADNDGDGNCDDFFLELAEVTNTCEFTASRDRLLTDLHLSVSPNPFDESTLITFNNSKNETFDVEISTPAGQVVRRIVGITGNQVVIDRNELGQGVYFTRFINREGRFATVRIVVQ